MPQVEISIGGRSFEVACQEGDEQYLQSAAKMLNDEAVALSSQIGRMPEARMLLMAGLMLADKTAVLEEKVNESADKMAALQGQIDTLQGAAGAAAMAGEASQEAMAALAELTARAEALADDIENKVGS